MARSNAGDHLSKDKVKLKKYFYILRPLLAIRYIQAGLGLPPVRFQSLVDAVAPEDIKGTIAELIQLKMVTPELRVGDAIPSLKKFILLELEKHQGTHTAQGRPDIQDKASIIDRLNYVFRQTVREAFKK